MCVWGGLLIFELYVHEIIQLAFFDFISSVLFLRCTCVDTCGYGSFTVVQRQWPHEIPTRLLEQRSLEMGAVPPMRVPRVPLLAGQCALDEGCPPWRCGASSCISMRHSSAIVTRGRDTVNMWLNLGSSPNLPDRSLGNAAPRYSPGSMVQTVLS